MDTAERQVRRLIGNNRAQKELMCSQYMLRLLAVRGEIFCTRTPGGKNRYDVDAYLARHPELLQDQTTQ